MTSLFLGSLAGVTSSYLSNVGIDTNAGDFTYVSNIPSTTRGLTKLGSNTLTLSGSNAYSGPTTINAGTLMVNGSLAAASAVTVNNSGTLGGTGTVGNVTVNSGGSIAPGSGAVLGALTVTSVYANSGSNLDFTLTGAMSTYLNSLGDVSLNNSSGTIALNIFNGGGLTAGTYPLIGYGTFARHVHQLDCQPYYRGDACLRLYV